MRAATGTTTIATMDFRASLPPASRLEGVSRDILQYADQRGVRLTSVAQQPGPISGQGIKTLEYTISAVTAYPAFKVWLADLLGRYPTLAVQQLSIRANGTDGLRQDVSLSLLFAYKE